MDKKKLNLETRELKELFTAIGISNINGDNFKGKLRKQRQIFDYLVHIKKVVGKLSTKRPINVLDCACGKSYLSFITNYYLTTILKRKVRFVCVDYNEHVIKKSAAAATKLGFDNMEFVCSDIMDYDVKIKPDIVYSLHACDTATDMTIAKGILEGAKYIMNVSCCQRTTNYQLKKYPLSSITRYGVYKERIVDMVSDSMRGLLLESMGYKVHLFDYVPSSETPKNIMLKAQKIESNSKKMMKAITEYKKVNSLFNIQPKLFDYLYGNETE